LERSPEEEEESRRRLLRTADDIMGVIQDWTDDPVKAHRAFLTILKSSYDFSRLLRRQRACWTVKSLIEPGFDPNRMDDMNDNADFGDPRSGEPVEMYVCPGLFKCGDADGEQYDCELPIIKPLVKCDLRL
jgi:hypothetical protein